MSNRKSDPPSLSRPTLADTPAAKERKNFNDNPSLAEALAIVDNCEKHGFQGNAVALVKAALKHNQCLERRLRLLEDRLLNQDSGSETGSETANSLSAQVAARSSQ